MAEGSQEKPTVFILYIPGGAMLGLIPAMTLQRIEALTETPTPELFQVIEGVSTGSILAAGFNIPGMTARRGAEDFAQIGPTYFPYIPGRWAKMSTRQGLNTGKVVFGLDPLETDSIAIKNIRSLCRKMRGMGFDVEPELIKQLEEQATEKWLTSSKQKRVLALCEEIAAIDPSISKHTEAISELIGTRTLTGKLSLAFKKAASGVIDSFNNWYAPPEECLYDPQVAEDSFKEMFGDMRLSDSVCSTYISAYDIVNKRIVTFSSLKEDLFDKDPKAKSTTQNNIKLWDAVMASTANELAWKAHITENNLLCTDKAPFHKPRSVNDVLAKVEQGTRVVMVIAGTGKFISSELQEYVARDGIDEDDKEKQAKYRKKLEEIRDRRASLGVAGNLILGKELPELEAYTMSDAMDDFGEKLGKENVFEFTPRLSPHTPKEKHEFPSRDSLDASEENVEKIIKRARKMIQEEDDEIRRLSQMLVDNLYGMGKMDQDKYARVCERIGLKTHDIEADVEEETKNVEESITSNDKATGFRKTWNRISRRFFGTGGPTIQPPRPPPGPGDDGPSGP